MVDEDCPPDELKPQSPYAETKLREEQLVLGLAATNGLRAVSCRFGTIFGTSPGMRFHTAVNKFCWQAVMGLPITVWKTAMDQKRPYLDLEDCVRAIALILSERILDGRIYNVVTTNATVREVVAHIEEHIPEILVELVEHQIMNQLSFEVLSDRVKAHGFEPHGNLGRGIAETIALLRRAGSVRTAGKTL